MLTINAIALFLLVIFIIVLFWYAARAQGSDESYFKWTFTGIDF